jgi:hypothetical protein
MGMSKSETTISGGAVVVRSREGQTLRWGPQATVRIIAGASSTDRSFSVVEVTEPPGGGACTFIMGRLKRSTFSKEW